MALPANGDLPQDSSIVSRWKLDEQSGSRADSVGSNTLTDNNTVSYGTGISELGASSTDAADFEHENGEYFSVADNASLSTSGDLTYFCWVNFETVPDGATYSPANYVSFANKWSASQRSWSFAYYSYSGFEDRLHISIANNLSNDATGNVSWSPVTDTWYHLGFVYDASAGEVACYVDGVQQGTTMTGFPNSIPDGTEALRIGEQVLAVEEFDGKMQDAILWNAELSAAEVTDLYELYTVLPKTFTPRTIVIS